MSVSNKFDELIHKFQSSKLYIVIDNNPLNKDDVINMGRQIWDEIMKNEMSDNPF